MICMSFSLLSIAKYHSDQPLAISKSRFHEYYCQANPVVSTAVTTQVKALSVLLLFAELENQG